MKKILLTTAAVAALSSTSIADMVENQYFVTGGLSAVHTREFKANGFKFKSKYSLGADLGVGYYVMENVRVSVVYNHPFISTLKSNKLTTTNATGTTTYVGSTKPKIHALFANVTGDIVDLGMGKLYLTAGLGWSRVQETAKVTTTTTPVAAAGVTPVSTVTKDTLKFKNKNNLGFTAGIGASFDVAEAMHLDLGYNYRAYGKAGKPKDKNVAMKAKSYNAHNMSVGIRFDI